MMATLLSTTLLASVALLAPVANAIHLNLPKTIAQCDKVDIDAGGKGLLNVAVLHAEDECGEPIKEWTKIKSAELHWDAKLPVGTKLVFLVEENDTEAEQWSEPITIAAGSTACLEGSGTSTIPAPTANGLLPSNPSTPSTGGSPIPPSTDDSNGAANVATDPNSEENAPNSAASTRSSVLAVAGALVFAALQL
ncbi:hypothetical protein AURDEDRAFT_116696 [Auricularia subglabra TFB-10046 SS5]|uniref:Uncharacterized protein n=1 Tax=Auricularia subglabra (strain TFB-10046 / SS5) TaxID=717982 RepID=J0DB33_AURST|nr:hypothetical protein AURDEDRAFT_116696 [Auricularia subglabra TFB-10046 SS5]